MSMAFTHRKQKKRNYRSLWITRISAACRSHDMSYSRFMEGVLKANIALNRKMLSEIAIHDPDGFGAIVERARQHAGS
jgi:large subunit ribosomal protein L20